MTSKSRKQKIVDFSKVRKAPERLPFHWAYVTLFALSLASSLWQHGHPVLTLSLLGSAFVIGSLPYISYAVISSNIRFNLQIFIVLASSLWLLYRLRQQIPLDKILIESVCITGLCFILAQRSSDYEYLFLMSMFLLLYGALLPRLIFLIIFILGFFITSLLLYTTRLRTLAGVSDIKTPTAVFSRSWSGFIMHFLLAGAFAFGLFNLMPENKSFTEGFFDVSFYTENSSIAPPGFMQWLMPRNFRKGKGWHKKSGLGKPEILTSSGGRVEVPESNYLQSSGNGASPPGKEIIFKAKSPLKLYWLAQLYDVYDGQGWKLSNKLRNARTVNSVIRKQDNILNCIEQEVVIEKWVSKSLYCAYRPLSATTKEQDNYYNLINYSAYNVTLKNDVFPKLPFYYSVTSTVFFPKETPTSAPPVSRLSTSPFWLENIKFTHYLKLPKQLISDRVRKLAEKLTCGMTSPFMKALTLRDYLRNNYRYLQYSQKTPDNREAVDFFLFDLREGHCEYFASALTVLARLSGLPARVATGFSPGNYNALNKCFEVHAYHAHAWTQIFIEGKGWLTFDAVPPGNVESVTTPFAIGKLRDPFGDEWRITPPEITKKTLSYLKQNRAAQLKTEKNSYNCTFADSMLLQISSTTENAKKIFKNIINGELKSIAAQLFKSWQSFKRQMAVIWQRILNRFALKNQLFHGNFILLIPFLSIVFAVFLEYRILKAFFNRRKKLLKCRQCFLDAEKNLRKQPNLTVIACYTMVRILLNMAGYPRRGNKELLDYGNSLFKVSNELRKNTVVLFYFYTKIEYGSECINQNEAVEALERTENICKELYPLINEPAELEKLKHTAV